MSLDRAYAAWKQACDDLALVLDRDEFYGDSEPGQVVTVAHVAADADGHPWQFSFAPVEDSV
jgi:hypothetical protein